MGNIRVDELSIVLNPLNVLLKLAPVKVTLLIDLPCIVSSLLNLITLNFNSEFWKSDSEKLVSLGNVKVTLPSIIVGVFSRLYCSVLFSNFLVVKNLVVRTTCIL